PTENVIDPTGAGDTFAGGMMGSIANLGGSADPGSYDSIRRSLAHATVTASFTIESFSLDRLKRLSRAEIDARYLEYAAMTRLV
ncbi:MAG: PfkB family carbohydrate kinase, partial [Phycisphaerales bacterium]